MDQIEKAKAAKTFTKELYDGAAGAVNAVLVTEKWSKFLESSHFAQHAEAKFVKNKLRKPRPASISEPRRVSVSPGVDREKDKESKSDAKHLKEEVTLTLMKIPMTPFGDFLLHAGQEDGQASRAPPEDL